MNSLHSLELCPKFERAFQLLGKRWSGLIIRTLLDGKKRFSDILQAIPNMSPRMLTERLKELENEELIIRTVYPEVPIRVEYELTEKGKNLKASMDAIQEWAEKWG
ncbi:HxlR family transcriptional regulator [Natranaerovirga pectinivora]|uniref:HxlR family transcriptional regulator n=1 Tax=Natranaerovirga pectinivora TaxID=682400 RepID=A0A4R3MI11_9FIRM|nr:helix-turn-helix domain-containing protein [Natranaerovirga pectinivora]TCT12886.1 HxlR family transcriptional regulator [Natranaerovirga pectinivora]